MLNVSLNYDNWFVKGEITSDSTLIDTSVNNTFFKIEIKDLFENYIHRNSKEDLENAIIADNKVTLAISNNETILVEKTVDDICQSKIMVPEHDDTIMQKYYNSDDLNLIKNGFQWWLGADNKCLIFRMVAKGKPTINGVKSDNYVGFTTAKVHVCIAENECVNFVVSLLPKLITGSFYNFSQEKDFQIPSVPKLNCGCCSGTGILYTNTNEEMTCPYCNNGKCDNTRVSYPFNDNCQNSLFVNNNDYTVSSEYKHTWNKNNRKYELNVNTEINDNHTPIYAINTSSFIPNYLINEEIEDILNPGTYAPRNFHFDETKISSCLIDDTNYPITYTASATSGEDYKMFTYGQNYISTDMTCNVYTQVISSTENKMLKNKIYFSLEV